VGGAPNDGRIAGTEWLAYSDDGSGRQNVTLMVQVPAGFDPARPCIVTATASGSRGVYGAISTGEWGLKKGCAVAYTDKGTGSAPHDLQVDTVPLIDGTRTSSAAAGALAHFRADLTPAQLAAFNLQTPNRLAFKHAHSQRNPEKDWGRFTLQAIEFAFYALNEHHGPVVPGLGGHRRSIVPANTLVIASSISNGGGAAIAAAELDTQGLIDGVAVSEPAVELPAALPVAVRRGEQGVPTAGKPLYDYITLANLYQACASFATPTAPANFLPLLLPAQTAARCQSLADRGLVSGATTAEQSADALQKLRQNGWEADSDVLHASLGFFEVPSAVSVTFANAYARASVADRLCGYGFGPVNALGLPTASDPATLAGMFAASNGVPPTGGAGLINERNPGFALRDLVSMSPSSGRTDLNLDGAVCLRGLWTGSDATARMLQDGVHATRRNGRLHGKPALIVHGRADALLPVNHTSRPYTALNKWVEGAGSRLSYIEVANGQHFDAFTQLLPGYDTRYVPVHLYLFRALDAMWTHLAQGAPLPASQVVRTVPRGGVPGAAPALQDVNVPPIALVPAAADAITMQGNTLVVPE
jgi:hydroxybutyrate-dimer hydrolase